MEKHNVSPNNLRQHCRLSNNQSACDTKSNIAKTLQAENFTPFDNIDPDDFINALEDDSLCDVADSADI